LDRRVQNTRLYSNHNRHFYTSDFTVSPTIQSKEDVKRAWERINIDYLQPNKCLKKKIYIEVKTITTADSAPKDLGIFVENHLNQVFTHPYTTQENGHIESFHAILANKLRPYNFWTLQELEQIWCFFYEKYNNENCILRFVICRQMSLECWKKGLIEQFEDENKEENHVQKNPIPSNIGQYELEVQFLAKFSDSAFLDELNFNTIENGAESFLQTSV
jgi:hypothetical protein